MIKGVTYYHYYAHVENRLNPGKIIFHVYQLNKREREIRRQRRPWDSNCCFVIVLATPLLFPASQQITQPVKNHFNIHTETKM